MACKPKRRMKKFEIHEISGVDVPAQEGATALIMKRHAADDPYEGDIQKKAWLTTAVEGHSHLVDEETYDGRFRDAGDTSWTRADGDENGHSHPWVRGQDGSITIGEAEGHSHDVLETTVSKRSASELRGTEADLLGQEKDSAKNAGGAGSGHSHNEGDTDMADTDKTKKAADAQPTVEQLQQQLARANSVAALSGVEKAHFDTIKDATAQDAFLAKSADDRKAEVDAVAKAATDADPVVYTTLDGVDLRKSAGDAFISMAKSNDALRKRLDESEARNADAELKKRADAELGHLPGTVDERAALLKAVDAIADEGQRTAALNALKAQNAAMAKAFEPAGHGGAAVAPGSPADQLDQLAKKHQDANPDATYERAYDAVLKTAEGQLLYAKSLS